MKRGLKSGQKVKKNGEYYNHRFHTAFTDDQFDALCDLANGFGLTYSAAIRNCVRIVCKMPMTEREKLMRSVAWKN